MAKLIVAALVLITLGAGVYFFLPQLTKQLSTTGLVNNTQQDTTRPADQRTDSSPSPQQPAAESGPSATTAEDDLTALEKELSDLQSNEAGFAQDLNSL